MLFILNGIAHIKIHQETVFIKFWANLEYSGNCTNAPQLTLHEKACS